MTDFSVKESHDLISFKADALDQSKMRNLLLRMWKAGISSLNQTGSRVNKRDHLRLLEEFHKLFILSNVKYK